MRRSDRLSRVARFVCGNGFGLGLGCALIVAGVASAQSLETRMQGVAEQKRAAASRDTTKASLLGALLYTDITCDFKGTPAKEAIDYIANALGIPLVGRYSTDKAGIGIDPELEITLKAESKPALVVLEMILDQCGADEPCTWQIRNSYVEVGTKQRLSAPSSQELRMYPVKDLLFEAPRFENAPEFNLSQSIQQGNQGGSGGGGSGGGGGGFGGGGGGGGFGGGGGGSGGGGGGNIIGDEGDDPERRSEEEKADELVNLILGTVEPDAWTDNGGDWASIRYHQGVLIVRAPDWIHRQLGGYPFAPAPTRTVVDRRYVTFTPGISIVENVKFRDGRVTGAAGGGGFGNGGNGGGGGGGGNPAPPAGSGTK